MVVKIGVNDLTVGMYVVDTGLSWMEHPYLYPGKGVLPAKNISMPSRRKDMPRPL
jgi:hypothetical protein